MKKSHFLLAIILLLGATPSFAQNTHLIGDVIKGFDLQELGIRFAINAVSAFILVRLIYFTRHRNKDFLFTFTLFNSVNFLICFLLSSAELEVGFAFGLFAIFSIMRYRTVKVEVKEMGYLFLCIAMGLINSLATTQNNYIVLLCSNAFILVLAILMDRTTTSHDESRQITYERIDLIKPELRNEMIQDLRNRTGLPIYKVNIVSIDLMQDVAIVKAYYKNEVNLKQSGAEQSQRLLHTVDTPNQMTARLSQA